MSYSHIVYKTENNVNGKYYIGKHSTENVNDGYLGSGKAFLRALQKYGKDAFSREVLAEFDTEEEALAYEEVLVTEEVIHDRECYNLITGGKSGSPNAETRQKISESLKGFGAGIPKGPFSSKHRENLSIAQRNKPPVTEETKKRISEANIKSFTGPNGDMRKEAIRQKLLGSKRTEESKQRMREAQLGSKHTEETKKKMRKPKSAEHKRKLSEAAKKRWAKG
jgi:hypothetical protein